MMSATDAVELADAADRAVFAEIGRLGERELADVKAWVPSGREGDQPRRDEKARRVLTEQLKQAIAAREAAEPTAGEHGGASAP
jgi:hypothetical protein